MTDNIGLRIALSGVLIACSALGGRALAKINIRRCALLAETMDSMQLLRIHMLDNLLPLETALEKSTGSILRETGARMSAGSAAEAWDKLRREQMKRGGQLDCLTAGDADALDRFFGRLGTTAREEQRQIFDSAIKELGALESAAREEGNRKNRLYTTLGALAGAAAAVGLI